MMFGQSQILEIRGFPGEKINQCIDTRIKGQDVDHLIDPFKLKNMTWRVKVPMQKQLISVISHQREIPGVLQPGTGCGSLEHSMR